MGPMRNTTHKIAKSIKCSKRSGRCNFEPLETRRLMAATPLVLNGTSANDAINFQFSSSLITVRTAALQTATSRVTTSLINSIVDKLTATINGVVTTYTV